MPALQPSSFPVEAQSAATERNRGLEESSTVCPSQSHAVHYSTRCLKWIQFIQYSFQRLSKTRGIQLCTIIQASAYLSWNSSKQKAAQCLIQVRHPLIFLYLQGYPFYQDQCLGMLLENRAPYQNELMFPMAAFLQQTK